MTTLVVRLPPRLAVWLAGAADRLGLEHEDVAIAALREMRKADHATRDRAITSTDVTTPGRRRVDRRRG
jgi:hypothetical protein